MIKSTKPGELIGVANQKMIELLAGNINSGGSSSMLKMVGTLLRSTAWDLTFIGFSVFALPDSFLLEK